MALLFEASFQELMGSQDEVEIEVEGAVGVDINTGEMVTEFASFSAQVDYSAAVDSFIDTFITTAQDLVPVDTGKLFSSIDAGGDPSGYIWAIADTDYAEYVEYGTYKMDAQPYFEPALEAALGNASGLVSAAEKDAYDTCYALAEDAFEFGFQLLSGGETIESANFFEFGAGLVGGIAMLALFFVPLLYLYGIMTTIGEAIYGPKDEQGSTNASGFGTSSFAEYIQII